MQQIVFFYFYCYDKYLGCVNIRVCARGAKLSHVDDGFVEGTQESGRCFVVAVAIEA